MATAPETSPPAPAIPPYRRLVRLLAPEGDRRLPPAVAAEVARAQDRSEIVTSLVQLAAVAFFAVFYALTPKAFPPDVPFEPVPVALALYAAFTLHRLARACRGRLGPVFLALSVLMDVAVLLTTIWSFHLQYAAPPAISLEAPTLMYLFILIALRALRLEPRWVVLTGLAGAAGWLALVAYVLADPRTEVTHSFLDHALGGRVLLGAEVDRVVSILVTTAILALALRRGRALLVRAAAERHASIAMGRFFAPEVAARIRAHEALRPGLAELRRAAVMVVDLRGFTALARALPPSEVMALLADYQGRIVPVVRAHGGTIDKFMGDGILASFGAVRPRADPAVGAMTAVEAVLAEGERWRRQRAARGLPAPAVVVTAAAGEVLFGTVGDVERLEYTVIGPPMDLAAKLEKHAKVERARAVVPADLAARARAGGWRPALAWAMRPARRVAGLQGTLDLAVVEAS